MNNYKTKLNKIFSEDSYTSMDQINSDSRSLNIYNKSAQELNRYLQKIGKYKLYLYMHIHDSELNNETYKIISTYDNLRVLHIDHSTQITDQGLSHLSTLKYLMYLHLRLNRNEITNEGLKHLQLLSKLMHLDLINANITDEGLKYLIPLRNLTVLHIGYVNMTDRGLKCLESLKNIEYLFIYNNGNITKQGIRQLKQTLSNTRVLVL